MSRDEVENCLQNSLVKKNLNIVNKIKEAIEYLERPTDQKIDYWLVTSYFFVVIYILFSILLSYSSHGLTKKTIPNSEIFTKSLFVCFCFWIIFNIKKSLWFVKIWNLGFVFSWMNVVSSEDPRIIILLTSSNNQISEFGIPNILFTCLIKQKGETFCNLYIEITQPFLVLSKSQRSLKMCSQNH